VTFNHSPQSQRNILIKYADKTNLLVPEHTNCQLYEEFGHVQNWALKNKMTTHKAKTKEFLLISPHPTELRIVLLSFSV